MAREAAEWSGLSRTAWFMASDPEGGSLGSGGGTAHLLFEAWKSTGKGRAFVEWLRADRKMILHGGGYLLMLAKDEEAAKRIREQLIQNPPNPRARIVAFSLSETGFQLTRS